MVDSELCPPHFLHLSGLLHNGAAAAEAISQEVAATRLCAKRAMPEYFPELLSIVDTDAEEDAQRYLTSEGPQEDQREHQRESLPEAEPRHLFAAHRIRPSDGGATEGQPTDPSVLAQIP